MSRTPQRMFVPPPSSQQVRLVILWERFLANDVLSGGHNNTANFVKDFEIFYYGIL